VARIEALARAELNTHESDDVVGAISARSVRTIAIAMMRDVHRLLCSPQLSSAVDAISWVWGSERGFSLSICCDALGLNLDVARAEYWLALKRHHPCLSPLVHSTRTDEVREIIQREVARSTEGAGQLDLFSFYENHNNIQSGSGPALH